LAWFSPVWLPAYCVTITVAQPEVKRLKTMLRSSTLHNLYNAVDGSFVGPMIGAWEEVEIDQRIMLPISVRDTKVHESLRKAVQREEERAHLVVHEFR
jgi:hypothetical protein